MDPVTTTLLNGVSLLFKTVSLVNLKLKRLRKKEYPALIVSIDNLSFGGTGKTTLVIHIGRELQKRGVPFAVVTRGYHSKLEKQNARVLPHHTVEDVGDEAMIYKNTFPGEDIYVGGNRHVSIRAALEVKHRVILLDDGFQSTDIAGSIGVMLINPAHPYYYLRNFKFLARGEDFIFFYRSRPRFKGCGESEDRKKKNRGGPVCGTYDFSLEGFCDASGRPVDPAGKTLLGFSALGDNRRFREDLVPHGLKDFKGFPDHHTLTLKELRALDRRRKEQHIDTLVCTQKDFVKIKPHYLENIPLIYAQNRIQLSVDIMDVLLSINEKKHVPAKDRPE